MGFDIALPTMLDRLHSDSDMLVRIGFAVVGSKRIFASSREPGGAPHLLQRAHNVPARGPRKVV